jgi:hypothetical protein
MRNILFALLLFASFHLRAQSARDTIKVDSNKVEKIKKIPLDNTPHKMPVVPLTPENKKNSSKKGKPVNLLQKETARKIQAVSMDTHAISYGLSIPERFYPIM